MRLVVDGKYEDPVTGELRQDCGTTRNGPTPVDIVVINLHIGTCNYNVCPPPGRSKSGRCSAT